MGKLIWLASYPKSGNTWLRAFLHNYLLAPATPHSINALTELTAVECAAAFHHPPGEPLTTQQTQQRRPAVHKRLTQLAAGPIFVKTHNANLAVAGVPLCTPALTAGVIHLVRDPRDIALSYSAFLNKPVDDIIAFMANPQAANRATDAQVFELLSSWSIHTNSWAEAKNRFSVRYEDLLADPAGQFARLIQFLGAPADPDRLQKAIRFSDFAALSTQESATGYRAAGTQKFFRTGTVRQWEAHLTQAQSARIIADQGETMQKYAYF
jgi:hypothetical protein